MSIVSGVVLCTSCVEFQSGDEDSPVVLFEEINKWLGSRGRLTRVEDSFGGSKHPQMYVAGGGFNYFPEDEFAAFVMALPWEEPENVVLIIEPENGATRVFRPVVTQLCENCGHAIAP